MFTGRRYRLYPAPEQAHILAQWIGCVRAVYNAKVEEERYLYWLRRYSKFSPSWTGVPEGERTSSIDQRFGHLKGSKVTHLWLHQVPSQLYRNAIVQWKQAWSNHWENPEHFETPQERRRGQNDSIWLTQELFSIEGKGRIHIGTAKRDLGTFSFKQHRRFRDPASVTLSRSQDGHWWLSFSFDDGVTPKSPEEILDEVSALSDREQAETVVGHDRGIVRGVQTSTGQTFTMAPKKIRRMQRHNRRIKALSKKLARQKDKTSHKRAKTKHKLSRTHAKIADIRRDHAHQVSQRLVRDTPAKVLVFEELKLQNMTRRPKPVPAKNGAFGSNGAKAKSGLNRSLLNQGLGMILLFTRYKAVRAGKLVLSVPAAYSSQECSCCGHTRSANRKSQAQFHCVACGHTDNADANAAAVIRKRGIAALTELLSAPGRGVTKLPVEATRSGESPSSWLGANEAGIRSTHLAAF